MRLLTLEVRALPGVSAPYRVTDVAEGVTVVMGPNASGKSSLVRALRALWNPELHQSDHVDVAAAFELRREDGTVATLEGRRLGSAVTWERDGVRVEPPKAPADHLLDSYLISIEALMVDGHTDVSIGDRLHREMSGGYDLPAARSAATLPQRGHQRAAGELERSRRAVEELEREREGLLTRQLERGELLERLAGAAERAAQRERFDHALKLREQLVRLESVRAEVDAYPAVLAELTGREAERLEELGRRELVALERVRQAKGQLAEARAALTASGLAEADIDGAAAERQERAATELEELAERAKELERREAAARARLREPWRQLGGVSTTLPSAAFDPTNLEAAEEALGERLAAAAQIEAARAELARLEALRAELRRRRGGERPEVAQGDPAGAAAPGSITMPAKDDGLDEVRLRGAQAALSDWLAAPAPAPAPEARLAPSATLALGALLLVAAALVGLPLAPGGGGALARLADAVLAAGTPFLLLLAAGSLALLVGGAMTIASARARGRRAVSRPGPGPEAEAARAAFQRSGAMEPFAWEHERVAERLEELLLVSAGRREAERQESAVGDLIQRTLWRQAAAESRLDSANNRLVALSRATGYDAGAGEPGRVGAGFAVWLRAAGQVREITGELKGLASERRQVEAQADELYAELASRLAPTPFALDEPVEAAARLVEGVLVDSKLPLAAELRQRSARLASAVRRRDQARLAAERASAELERARQALAEAERARTELLASCGIDPAGEVPEAQLRHLLAGLQPFREARDLMARLEAVAGVHEEALEGSPELLAAARRGDTAALELGRQAAEAAAAQLDALNKELGALDHAVRGAEQGRAAAEARAKLQQREDEVAEHLRRAQLNAALELLFDDVEAEHRVKREPEVLRRARGWFDRFTHHAYRLEFEPNAPRASRIAARDTSSRQLRRPSQLSTGTRAQLLLALRVAYASLAEEGLSRLPFFLDEALTTADAARFAQVAASLLELAHEDGRQVIYLTAREEDAAAWRQAAERFDSDGRGRHLHVIDLAEVRRLESAARWRSAPRAARSFVIPDPNEVPVAEFAAALGVAAIDPWREPSAVHLFHLWSGDLTPLRRLAQARILTAGQAQAMLRSGRTAAIGEADAELLRRRLAALEAWHDAWRCGRHFPVDESDLRNSKAVSETFLGEVAALAHEVGGDPRALLDALEGGRVAYFRVAAVAALEEWLEEHGYFDTRPRLEESERIVVTAEALARAAGAGVDPLPEELISEARQLVERFEAALEGEKEHA